MGKNIRVGFIGLNPDGHWAATAHFPALKALTDKFTVVGVANSTLACMTISATVLGQPPPFKTPSPCMK
jgi:predicted dehydrogenase